MIPPPNRRGRRRPPALALLRATVRAVDNRAVHNRAVDNRAGATRVVGACAIAAVAWCTACDPKAPAPVAHAWPPGTVLALGDTPILADEVDAAGSMVAVIEPSYSLEHLRRIGLTNVVLPRIAGIQLAGEARASARRLAEQCRAMLAGGSGTVAPLTGAILHEREGGYGDVGMECFDYAVNAPVGTWSDVVETIGMFEIYRVEERSAADAPRETKVRVTACVVPYLDPDQAHAQIEARLDRSRIVFVAEAWRDIVPEYWKHRLSGEVP